MRQHLTYANVMATAAVFIALGGTSYAVTALPRNSVGSKQIRDNAVGTGDVRNRSIQSLDIRRGTIKLDESLQAACADRGRVYAAAVDVSVRQRGPEASGARRRCHDTSAVGEYRVGLQPRPRLRVSLAATLSRVDFDRRH